jgi:hypothetical protein
MRRPFTPGLNEAWRDLAWLIPDATEALIRYPAETFGPLPGTTA